MLKKMLKLLARPAEFSTYDKLLEEINRIKLSGLSHDELKNRVKEFKDKFSAWLTDKYKDCRDMDNVSLNKLLRETAFTENYLTECYAITKELCGRSFKLEAYDSQLLCGIALHFGNIAQLPTGEGKTMAAVFPAVLNALAGRGVHILTFNDYLANRDALWMKSIYDAWGLSVDFIQDAMEAQSRKNAYRADITYMTPREAGFDFLRDSLVYSPEELVQRSFNYVIVDEADSILIDEARVPLVIAGKDGNQFGSIDKKLVQSMEKLRPEVDYLTDENKRNVFLTDTGINILERELNCGNLYKDNLELLTFINNLLHAKNLLKKDVDYIVRNNRVEIVDEFTGRIADRRKWHAGLQMAVEALEGISYTPNSRILGRITIQNFISLYPEMAGMTATAQSSEEEFLDNYNRRVYIVQPEKKCIRVDYPDEVFTHKAARDRAIEKEILEVHNFGRPILIGTSSIEESESLAERLQNCGIDCAVLNARNDTEEAGIIANAGRLGAVTVSTNMAGRGVDIKLGDGRPESAETNKVIALGGLYVLGTNKNECIRIDSQLKGRAGRQGDPGASRFFISLEDELLTRFEIRKLLPQKYLGYRQEEKIKDSKLNSLINHIQRVVDGQSFDARKNLGKYALLLEYQRRLLTKKRDEILYEKVKPLLPLRRPELYMELCRLHGAGKVAAVGRRIAIHFIDECWFAFLDYCESVQEGIHLVGATRKVPLDEYRKLVIQEFDSLMNRLEDDILLELEQTDFSVSEADFAGRGFSTPAATWTYMINDNIKVKRFSLFGTN